MRNEVFRFKVKLHENSIEIPVKYSFDSDYIFVKESIVARNYFTKEKIEEIKKEFIRRIEESEFPFEIHCVDIEELNYE